MTIPGSLALGDEGSEDRCVSGREAQVIEDWKQVGTGRKFRDIWWWSGEWQVWGDDVQVEVSRGCRPERREELRSRLCDTVLDL